MNAWKEIWFAYHSEATISKILAGIWKHAGKKDRIVAGILIVVFTVCFYMYVTKSSDWWIAGALIGEIAFLFRLNTLKNDFILSEYDNKGSQPLSENQQQSTRYLMFEKKLKKENITAEAVNECKDLIGLQIDISSTDMNPFHKQITFLVGLLAGISSALWKGLDVKSLMLIALFIIAIALMFSMFSSIFPSKEAKLKELKYFMLLYGKN